MLTTHRELHTNPTLERSQVHFLHYILYALGQHEADKSMALIEDNERVMTCGIFYF